MNAPAKIENTTVLISVVDAQVMDVLRNSLYVGAKDESIKMVLAYCRASNLDPLQKPVHLVPMWDAKSGQMRDVVMPGIGLYRTQAARSGNYAGVSEPEYGPDVKENLGGVEITYPAWCKVTVKRRLDNGSIAEFTALERWKENYAVKGGKEKSIAPNSMWIKRPYAQIAKCAEAQALRKAFPEFGSQPTADEMEGKDLGEVIDNTTGEITNRVEKKPELPPYTEANYAIDYPDMQSAINAGKATPQKLLGMLSTKFIIGEEWANKIRELKPQAPVVDSFVADMNAAEERGELQ
jgi:phage recombination protein Bet